MSDPIRDALAELVDLHDSDSFHEGHAAAAWAAARAALAASPAPLPRGESITFDALVAHGLANGANVVNGMPWSWNFYGIPVTHENDNCYLLCTTAGIVRVERPAAAPPVVIVPREPIGWTDGTAVTGHRVVVRLAEGISFPVGTPLYDAATNDQPGGKGVIGSLPGHTEGQKMPGPPDPIAAQPEWKCGNEFAPYHPDASHVPPEYRDGWNACYKVAADALRRERDRANEATDAVRRLTAGEPFESIVVAHTIANYESALRADRDRLAAECEHWRNVTARANPTDCAVGIRQLYDNWQQTQAECERLRTACGAGWGEPTLINTLRRENNTLRNVAVTADERAERAEAERDALRAQLHEIARLWDMPSDAMPQDWRDLWRAAIDAARGK